MGSKQSKRPDGPPQLQFSGAEVKQLFEAQKREYDRKWQRERKSIIEAEENLMNVAKTAAALRSHYEVDIAARKLQEEAACLAAQRKEQEEALLALQKKLQKEAAQLEAQRKLQEEIFINAHRNLQEEVSKTVAQRQLEDAAAKRTLEEAAAMKKLEKAAATRKLEEAAAKRKLEEEAAKRKEEEAAKRKEEEAVKRKLEDEALKRKLEEEAFKRKLQEEAFKKKLQEDAFKRKLEEEIAVKKKYLEEVFQRKLEEDAAKRKLQEEAFQRKLEKEAAKKKLQDETAKRKFETKTLLKINDVSKKVQEEPTTRTWSKPGTACVSRFCNTCYKPSTTMFKCEEGHGSCQDCKCRLRGCGICSSTISDRRSFDTKNDPSPQTKVPCLYKDDGCKLFIRIADMENHAKECPFREQDCPIGAVFGNCKWQGELYGLRRHFEDRHPDRLMTKMGSELYIKDIHRNQRYVYLIKNGYYFVFHLKISEIDNKVYMVIQLIGTKQSAMKCLYEIHVYSKSDTSRTYMYTDICCSTIDNIDDVFKNEECAVLPLWYANTFVSNDALTLKLFIRNVTPNSI